MAIIDNPKLYFQTKLYTGNGSTNHAITLDGDENMQPDLSWIKQRSGAEWHILIDSVRGVTKYINSNDTGAERTSSNFIESFDSNGFTLGSANDTNQNSQTYASWNFKAGGTAVSNTDGSITSSVSANQDAGFSIVSWTGNGTDNATVGHGLSQKPDMVIIKARENTSSWLTWHKDLTGAGYAVFLDATDAQANYNILKNQSSSVLTLSTNSAVNANTQGFISYNFHSVQGYSKFGSYTGNGSTDGTFVYTGFKPAFVIQKRTDSASNWEIYDNKRGSFNTNDETLYANLSNVEADAGNGLDFLAQGFKWRTNASYVNASGGSYIYMSFAENPFVTSSGVPATAR